MRILNTVVTTLGLGAAAAGALAAQQAHQHQGEQVGRVRFPVSCPADVRHRFERGVALLHSFWYEKAADAFRDVVAADSTCAMGYWGQAMAILHPLWTPPSQTDLAAGLAAAERGLALAKTPRERDYLAAIRAYYADYASRDPKARLVAYAEAMEGVQRRNPRDREAAIFYALALIAVGQANPTDTTFANQKRADSILEPLFKAQPAHPGLAHYLIHTNDVPQLAHLGLYAARRYAGIAPDVPHAQHMPSHIFTRLGLWDEDIASNVRSAEAARRFEVERHLNALWDQRGHAWDYLVYAYLQTGRDGAAKRILDEAAGVTAGVPGRLPHQCLRARRDPRALRPGAGPLGRGHPARRAAGARVARGRGDHPLRSRAGRGAGRGHRAGARGDRQARGDRAGARRGGRAHKPTGRARSRFSGSPRRPGWRALRGTPPLRSVRPRRRRTSRTSPRSTR